MDGGEYVPLLSSGRSESAGGNVNSFLFLNQEIT